MTVIIMIKPTLKAKIVKIEEGAGYEGKTYDQTVFFKLSNGVTINLFDYNMLVNNTMIGTVKTITAAVFITHIKKTDKKKYGIKLNANAKPRLCGSDYNIYGQIVEIIKKHFRFIVNIGVGNIIVIPNDDVSKNLNIGDFMHIPSTCRFDLYDIQ